MRRSIHRSACAALVLTALALTGCECKRLNVLIPDFEDNLIQGIELWRANDEASEIWSEAGRIVFGGCISGNGSETIQYTMVDSQNRPMQYTIPAWVIRSEGDGSVTLHFLLSAWREPPGWIRASTFNAVGDSDLSEEAVFL